MSLFAFPRPLTASLLLLCGAAGLTLMGACTQLSEVTCLSSDECSGQVCLAGRCVDPIDGTDSGLDADTTADVQVDADTTEVQDALPDGDTTTTDVDVSTDVDADTDDGSDTDVDDAGDTVTLNACGGNEALIGTLGARCGSCAQGQLACVPGDNNALSCVGDTSVNACGGCAEISVVPGTGCRAETEDGTWICNGPDAAVCVQGTGLNACGGRDTLTNVPGDTCGVCSIWLCGTGRELACLADEQSADCRPDDTCESLGCAEQNQQCLAPDTGDAVCGECLDGFSEVEGLCIPQGSACDDESDCPDVPGDWLACEWETECAETGSRDRPVQVGTCFNSACIYAVTSESEPCVRNTDGIGVGSAAPAGECQVSSECSAVGLQEWTVTRCLDGRPAEFEEERACESPRPPLAPGVRTLRVEAIRERSAVVVGQLESLGQPVTTEVGYVLTRVDAPGSSPRVDYVFAPILRSEFRISVDSLEPGTAYTLAAAAEWECSEVVARDAIRFVTLPGVPQNLEVSDGTTFDCVDLRWEAVAGATSYEVSIGAAAFVSVGNVTSWRDCDARQGTIVLEQPSASDGTSRTEVSLSIANPVISQPGPQAYRVRAVNGSGAGEVAGPESGRLGVDVPQIQWQRTSRLAESDFTDVPGLTGRNTSDTTGPGGGALRFYRVRVTAPGAAPAVSAADVGYRATSCSCGPAQTECNNEQGTCNSPTGCCAFGVGCAIGIIEPC